jgi:hypothetical protein
VRDRDVLGREKLCWEVRMTSILGKLERAKVASILGRGVTDQG